MKKRSVVIAGHRTSISLEDEFWADLVAVADARGVSLNALVKEIDATRAGNLSSALRLFVRACYRTGELPPRPAESSSPRRGEGGDPDAAWGG